MKCTSPLKLGSRIVPCGKCYACRSKRRNQWSARLTEEARYHERNGKQNLFITLTYDEENVPFIQTDAGAVRVAVLQDVSAFVKRLRKSLYGSKKGDLRFFAVSEYGPKTLRPHFHIILFGLPPKTIRILTRLIEKAWNYQGFVTVSHVTRGRIRYCAKYCLSEFMLPDEITKAGFKNGLRCSKGLGKCHLTKSWTEFYRRQSRLYYTTKEGYKVALPEYWQRKIFSPSELRRIHFEHSVEESYKQLRREEDFLDVWFTKRKTCSFKELECLFETSPYFIDHRNRERDLHKSVIMYNCLLKKHKL